MPWIDTSAPFPRLDAHETYQVYNALDCAVTHEVFGQIEPMLDENTRRTYDFELAMRAPAVEMSLRGIKIDQAARLAATKELTRAKHKLRGVLNTFSQAIWDKPLTKNTAGLRFRLNPNSPAQLKSFFYEHMHIPEIWVSQKGERRVSTNRESLETIFDQYFHARPLVSTILAYRDVAKQLSVLETEIDPDGRMRTTYNVAGTETGRWSSYVSAFDTGTNFQNIADALRKMFIADELMKMAYYDLEQAESRVVGLLARAAVLYFQERMPSLVKGIDPDSYLNACESGDLHTTVCRMVWPQLTAFEDIVKDGKLIAAKGTTWGDDPKINKALANQTFYRTYSYRDMAKRGGHGTNYYGTPVTMARHLKVTTSVMRDFQDAYFTAFPCIRIWHQYVRRMLQMEQSLTTPLGRKRIFFGRPDDDATLREAIAYVPQSVVGDLLNYCMYLVWRSKTVQLLAQIHDAIVFQFPETDHHLLDSVRQTMAVPLTYHGRTIIIPSEPKVGWNWSRFDKTKNPLGLKDWTGSDERRRLY